MRLSPNGTEGDEIDSVSGTSSYGMSRLSNLRVSYNDAAHIPRPGVTCGGIGPLLHAC
jgi:hypothetical protein